MPRRAILLAVFGCLILRGAWLARAGEYSILPDSTVVGQNYGYPSGTPGQGPTPPGNLDVVFETAVFAKNLELTGYPDDSIPGQTYIGFLAPLRFRYRASEETTIEAGAILGHNFGDDNGLDVAEPLLRLVYQPNPNQVIVGGTLLNTHWIHDALYDDVHVFRRPAEQGFQYRADNQWLKEDVWIDWCTRETQLRSERFDVADSTQLRLGNLWLDGQFLWAHVGGQKNLEHRVVNNGNCLLGGSYGVKVPLLGNGELRFGTYYLTGFQTQDDVSGRPASRGGGHEFRLWYDVQPTPWSMLRLFGSSYQGHGLVAWLGDPLYRKDSYSQVGFDLLLWLRGNFRMEWGLEGQWVDGHFMNSYQVNFVWGESFHCVSRQPSFHGDPGIMPPEQWRGPEEVPVPPATAALPSSPPGLWPSPAAAVSLTPLPPPPGGEPGRPELAPNVPPGVGDTSGVRLVSEEQDPRTRYTERPPASQSAIQPVGYLEPLGQPEPEPEWLSRSGGGPGPAVGSPALNPDAAGPPDLNVQQPWGPDRPTLLWEDHAGKSFSTPLGNGSLVLESLPQTQLWRVPMANPREPRCSVNLNTLHDRTTIDTAIGAVFGLARVGPADNSQEGCEVGLFAAAFTRFFDERRPFSSPDGRYYPLTAVDYRVGVPLTLAKGNWQMKLSYEHTSGHLGDEYMLLNYNFGITAHTEMPVQAVRDEGVLGIARFFGDAVRLYGQFGYSFTRSDTLVGKTPVRYDWGLEYSPPTPPLGGPFAAFDMDLRAEQDFCRNVTVQTGWQWKTNENRRSSARVGVQYYDGKSPFGQFYNRRESSWGVVAIYEW